MKIATWLSTFAAFLVFFHLGCHKNKQSDNKDTSTKQKVDREEVCHATTLEEIIKSHDIDQKLNNFDLDKINALVAMYSTEGCVPCEVLKPNLKRLIETYNAEGTNIGGIIINYQQFPDFLKDIKAFPDGAIYKKDITGKFMKVASTGNNIEQFKRSIDKYVLGKIILPEHDTRDLTIILQRLIKKPNTIAYNSDIEQFEIKWDLTNLWDIKNCGNYTSNNKLINLSREVRKIVIRKARENSATGFKIKFPIDNFYRELIREFPFDNKFYLKYLYDHKNFPEEEIEINPAKMLSRGYLTVNDFDNLYSYICWNVPSIKEENPMAEKTRKFKVELYKRKGEFFQSYITGEYREIWEKYTRWLSEFYEGNAESCVFPAELPEASRKLLEEELKGRELIYERTIPSKEELKEIATERAIPDYALDWLEKERQRIENLYREIEKQGIIYLPFNTPREIFNSILRNHDYVVAYKNANMNYNDFVNLVKSNKHDNIAYVILEANRDAFLLLYIEPHGITSVFTPLIEANPLEETAVIYWKGEPVSVRHSIQNSKIGFREYKSSF